MPNEPTTGCSLSKIEIFSTAPRSDQPAACEDYLREVAEVARWSEEADCKGILVYSDNSMVDPWLVSQTILQATTRLCPLVAVQPIYVHPYSVAKMIATIGHLYGRRIYLNMIAGGFKNDLIALGDHTPHDKRYTRIVEYTSIILQLLSSRAAISFRGEFYRVDNLKMTPPLGQELQPGVLLSGSSEAGMEAARTLRATAVKYPKPTTDCMEECLPADVKCGIRVGIITREDEDEAWEIAEQRFPESRKGQVAHQLAMKISDSSWHKQLSDVASHTRGVRNPYWLRPFENYHTFCPYLVGSYARVAEELSRYIASGFRTLILDIPASREELRHIPIVFQLAAQKLERTTFNKE
ncbi:MAG: LLM class flavin-dependent oxidoreductase [Candidatus Acidiferrales bacterium]